MDLFLQRVSERLAEKREAIAARLRAATGSTLESVVDGDVLPFNVSKVLRDIDAEQARRREKSLKKKADRVVQVAPDLEPDARDDDGDDAGSAEQRAGAVRRGRGRGAR